ncbi:MAG: CDP-diacylglycerol--glycerol-3-phosphate 3-phosphatidyltransferase [Acholeplasmataceae bacterium]|nr:CDP-diacylglycerol--glycerol-3-phosphate 3-phosphatidyltransferase [Acholeplasmataceae bacterium]
MTISNKLTISRMLVIPIMIILLFIPVLQDTQTIFALSLAELLFAILFTLGSITDWLDGYLARKRNEITTFGKFLDPIADKLLVISAMLYIAIFRTEYVSFWWSLVLIVIFRELLVSAVRMLGANKQVVIAASWFGKIKTIVTMPTLVLILFNRFGLDSILGSQGHYLTDVLFYISVLLTLLSGIDYLYKNRAVLQED